MMLHWIHSYPYLALLLSELNLMIQLSDFSAPAAIELPELMEKEMKKTLLYTTIILAIIVAALFLLQPKSKQPPEQETTQQPRQQEQISLYHYFSGSLSGGMSEMVASVNSRSGDSQVLAHALNHEAFKSMIHVTLAKENPPELFSYWAGAKTQALVDQDKLEPIDDIWQSTPLTDRFTTPVTQAASTYNGKKYFLPITEHFIVFFYNKKLFERGQLSPPSSWSELMELAEELKRQKIIPFALGAKERWPAQFWFDYLLLRTAGPDYRQALMDLTANYTDPEVLQVYSLWGKLLQKGYFNDNANDLDWAEASSKVCSGQAAMTLMGTWAIPFFSGKKCGLAEESGFDFFVFPKIAEQIPTVALGPVDGLILIKGSAGLQLAKNILPHFSEIEPQKRLSEESGAFSPNSLISSDFYSPLRQRILKESERSSYWAFNYDLATPSAIADKGMDSFNEIIAFPDQAVDILKNLQTEIEQLPITQ